jgi:cephalosporin hydroxylase
MALTVNEMAWRLVARFLPKARELQGEVAAMRTALSEIKAENARLRTPVGTRQNIGSSPLLFLPPAPNGEQQALIDAFHNFMYDVMGANGTRSYFVSWLGYGMFKWPTDLWNYQQIVADTKPAVIIETGTHRGGSAFFLATICDLLGHGEVISVDIDQSFSEFFPRHPRITYMAGSSTDSAVVESIKARIGDRTDILVILDSDHRCDHVLEELRIYSRFVPADGHLIVEDTNINGHPAYPEFGPGPSEAVATFLTENPDFYIDKSQERFFLTQNPNGFLRRRPLRRS